MIAPLPDAEPRFTATMRDQKRADILALIGTLRDAYHWEPMPADTADLYAAALLDLPLAATATAVSQYVLDPGRFRPSVGALRATAEGLDLLMFLRSGDRPQPAPLPPDRRVRLGLRHDYTSGQLTEEEYRAALILIDRAESDLATDEDRAAVVAIRDHYDPPEPPLVLPAEATPRAVGWDEGGGS